MILNKFYISSLHYFIIKNQENQDYLNRDPLTSKFLVIENAVWFREARVPQVRTQWEIPKFSGFSYLEPALTTTDT